MLLDKLGLNAQIKEEPAKPVYDEIESAAMANAANEMGKAVAAIEETNAAMNRLFQTADMVEGLKPTTPEGRKVARAALAQAAIDFAGESAVVAATAGLESEETTDVGLESWKSIKEYAKSAIDYLVKKWGEFTKFLVKYFKRYFGNLENLRAAWLKIKEKAEERKDWSPEEKKHEFTRAVDFYMVGTSVKHVGDFKAGVTSLKDHIDAIQKKFASEKPEVRKLSELLDGEGKLVEAAELAKLLVCSVKVEKLKDSKRTDYTHASPEMLGRRALFVNQVEAGTDAETIRAALTGARAGIQVMDPDQKEKEKATVELCGADDLRVLAENNIAMLDSLIAFMGGKELTTAQDAIDKQVKEMKGWSKQAPADDASFEQRNGYRTAVSLGADYVGAMRRCTIEFAQSIGGYGKSLSGAQLIFARQALKNLKKPEAAA